MRFASSLLLCFLAFAPFSHAQEPALTDLGPGCGLPSDPVLTLGLPTVGSPIRAELSGGPPNAGGTFVISRAGPPLNFLGCTVHVGLEHVFTLPFTTDAAGDWSFTFPDLIPASILGQSFNAQALILNGGFSFSNGVQATIGAAQARIRVLHASPDAPNVNVLVNGATLLSNVPYKTGSAWTAVPGGAYTVDVQGILPGGNASVIGPITADLGINNDYTVIAVDTVANISPLVIVEPRVLVGADDARVRVVHAAPAAPQVDVYVTAPNSSLAGASPLGSFSFRGQLGPVTVPGADYRIRVTLAGTSTVVFDSGTVSLPRGCNLVVAAVENTTTSASPISLVVLDGNGSAEVLDAATPAGIRVVHASADAPTVDVVVNNNFASPLFAGASFGDVTGFALPPAGTYNVKVAAAGTTTTVIDANLTLEAGTETTVLAINSLANIQPLVLQDDSRPVATEAKVRLIHASPAAGLVDIYVTAVGVPTTAATPVLSGVPFAASTGYLMLAGGSYDVTVTPAGSTTAAIGPVTLNLINGGVYSAAAVDAPGGGAPLGLITFDDL